jgi:regulation of enolase protein 1 (concanavalin A-like superfamily)
MKRCFLATAWVVWASVSLGAAEQVIFKDDFKGKLAEGWSWVREDRQAWRVSEEGLSVRVQPGSLWGPANDAKNLLVRPAPDPSAGEAAAAVTVTNQPSRQYEQVGMAWYYDGSHMVKLVKEQVDNKTWVVMGREQADRAALVGKVALDTATVRLRFVVSGNRIRGQFLPDGSTEWKEAGACDLPAPPAQAKAKVCLHGYQGPPDAEHWARFTEFSIVRTGK